MADDKDLFGEPIPKDVILREKFIEPPFSVLDTRGAGWQNRKRQWIVKGIKSEVGRKKDLIPQMTMNTYTNRDEYYNDESREKNTSIFDPALTELLYTWFCPEGGKILDPFAGGSVRGIVAQILGFKYTGIELRQEQVDANREQAVELLPVTNQPQYYCGDSDLVLSQPENWAHQFDFLFSCPPYADLEVYSELPEDLSNMDYPAFLKKYRSIIEKALALLKKDCFACFVVGEVRDREGYYYDFVGDTKKIFIESGAKLYNDAILLNSVGSASMRASRIFQAGKKLVKIHQNVLIFKKI